MPSGEGNLWWERSLIDDVAFAPLLCQAPGEEHTGVSILVPKTLIFEYQIRNQNLALLNPCLRTLP